MSRGRDRGAGGFFRVFRARGSRSREWWVRFSGAEERGEVARDGQDRPEKIGARLEPVPEALGGVSGRLRCPNPGRIKRDPDQLLARRAGPGEVSTSETGSRPAAPSAAVLALRQALQAVRRV